MIDTFTSVDVAMLKRDIFIVLNFFFFADTSIVLSTTTYAWYVSSCVIPDSV
jgi:hypothetical protein